MTAGERRAGTGMRRRAALVAGGVALGLLLAGCGEDPAPDAVAGQQLGELSDRIEALEERFAELEGAVDDLRDREPGEVDGTGDDGAGADGEGAGDSGDVFDDRGSAIGERVTVRATVAEVIPTTSLGTAFRIAGRSGVPVSVLSATPSPSLTEDDVVEVSGTVVRVDPDTFEEDIGIADEQLLVDPDRFFDESDGRIAISATEIRTVRQPQDD